MNFASLCRFSFPLGSILLSSFLVWGSTAKADVSVSPMVIEAQSKRNQSQGIITVSNLDPQAFRARVYTSPFTYDKEKGFQALSSSPNDLAPYLQFSPRELQVGGSDSRNIRYIVRFPPSLPDGEYRTIVFTENLEAATVTQQDTKNNVVLNTIVPRIGVALYVRKGNVSPNLSAATARLDPTSKQVQLLVSNQGKASAIVGGNWTVRDKNQVIQTGNIIDTTVIAEGERYLALTPQNKSKQALEPGEYQLSGELVWGEEKKNKMPFRVNLTIPKN